MTDASERLPQAPESLLELLRRAETGLADLDALRAEIHAVRVALEAENEPPVEVVTGVLSATFPAVATIEASGVVEVVSDSHGSIEVIPSGTGTSTTTWSGEATGEAPPLADAASRDYIASLKKYGVRGAKVADFLVRAASLGEKFL